MIQVPKWIQVTSTDEGLSYCLAFQPADAGAYNRTVFFFSLAEDVPIIW